MLASWKSWQSAPPEAQVALDAAIEGLALRPDHPGYQWAHGADRGQAPVFRPDGPEPGISWVELAQACGDTAMAPNRFFEPHTGMIFCFVPPGEYFRGATRRMGERNSDASAQASEGPVHRVRLTQGAYLGRTQVTVGQYQKFLDATGHVPPRNLLPEYLNTTPFHPVVGISWLDANAFMGWLSEISGRSMGLPVEALWEWAARGSDGRRYPWGRRTPGRDQVHLGERYPQAVGQKPGNGGPFGHLDLLGNVQELCEDIWGEYGRDVVVDPLVAPVSGWPVEDALRVVRGCAVNVPVADMRGSARSAVRPGHFFPWLGFRGMLRENTQTG